jgi:hypothetical protein
MAHILVTGVQHVKKMKLGTVALAEIHGMMECHLRLLGKIAAI